MTRWHEVLRIALSHDYLDGGAAGMAVQPRDPEAMARDGLLLRRDGDEAVVLAPEGVERPAVLPVLVLGDGPGMVAATRGAGWQGLPLREVGQGPEAWELDGAEGAWIARARGDLRGLAALDVALPPEGVRRLTLRFRSVELVWAYHVLGGGDDLEVVDPEGAIHFDHMGAVAVAAGRDARLIRSRQGIAARARPPQRFALRRPGASGPRILMPVLPAPAMDRLRPVDPATDRLRLVEADGPEGRLQADIYVTLTQTREIPTWP
jgi:hypothetical protein